MSAQAVVGADRTAAAFWGAVIDTRARSCEKGSPGLHMRRKNVPCRDLPTRPSRTGAAGQAPACAEAGLERSEGRPREAMQGGQGP